MRDQIAHYVVSIFIRSVHLALSAVLGILVAGMVGAMSLQLLHHLGIISYEIKQQALLVLAVLGACWGMAHRLEDIL